MSEWLPYVALAVVVLIELVRRLPWVRTRAVHIETRIGRADIEFEPLPPPPAPTAATTQPRALPPPPSKRKRRAR